MSSDLLYEINAIALAAAVVMIITARRGFNGFAWEFVAMGLLLIVRRVEETMHLIGEPGMAVISSLVTAVYCHQAWSVWKDRNDHEEYVHWREQHAHELRLIQDWQQRMHLLHERENELERLRAADAGDHWDYELPIARQTQNVARDEHAQGRTG